MMGNDRERPCDSCVLLDSAILAYTLLKIEFFMRPVYSLKHNKYLLSYILKFLICIHAGNPRMPPRGGKNIRIC